ncbi:hypothetical protein GGI42DRAFT_318616 [Trichoderma sp. SZMC 28013]
MSWPGSKGCGSVAGRDSVWRHGAGHDNCLLLFVLRICNARAHLSILRRPHSTELHLYSTWVPDVPSRAGSRFKRASITGKSLSFAFCSKPELLKLGTRMTYLFTAMCAVGSFEKLRHIVYDNRIVDKSTIR